MYEEYVDRQGEVVTGIVQQAGDRNNVARRPRSRRVAAAALGAGRRRAVRAGKPYQGRHRRGAFWHQGTAGHPLAPRPGAHPCALRARSTGDRRRSRRDPRGRPRAGYRSKIAVESHMQGVDPVGACVGPRGSRVRMVVSELRGEKIDIIPWNTEPARFVAKALSPARVREVYIDDETREATVVVPNDQLALAIGKEGLNARLATRLTGWKIDIQSEQEFAQAEAELAYAGSEDGEEFSGRCAAVLSNGKRCPNAALPGSHYCGVPAHQELANRPACSGGSRGGGHRERGAGRGRRARSGRGRRGRGRRGVRRRGEARRGVSLAASRLDIHG